MGRHAKIIDRIQDAWGDWWDVREYRQRKGCITVALGWPANQPRGRGGCGGVRAIITPELKTLLERRREDRPWPKLAIGKCAHQRLRRILGIDGYIERQAWWLSRIDDLLSLTQEAFAAKHGVSTSRVSQVVVTMFGRRIRPAGWWRADPAASLLLGTAPIAYVADRLHTTVSAATKARWLLRRERWRPA